MITDETKIVVRTPGSFFAKHPFVLSDGRRFASVKCAAQSAVYNEKKHKLSIHDEWTGRIYSHRDCVEIVNEMESSWSTLMSKVR